MSRRGLDSMHAPEAAMASARARFGLAAVNMDVNRLYELIPSCGGFAARGSRGCGGLSAFRIRAV